MLTLLGDNKLFKLLFTEVSDIKTNVGPSLATLLSFNIVHSQILIKAVTCASRMDADSFQRTCKYAASLGLGYFYNGLFIRCNPASFSSELKVTTIKFMVKEVNEKFAVTVMMLHSK